MMHYAFYFIFRWFLGKVLYFINLFSYLSIYFYIEFIRKPWMLLLTIKNLMVQNFSWLHDWVNHIDLHIVETEILPNIYFNDKKASKRSQEKLLSIYDIIHPSIHLSSSNLFVFCWLICFSFGKEGGEGKVPYLICLMLANLPFISNAITFPFPPPHLPILMRWCRDKSPISSKHFRQSIKVCFIRCRYQYDGFIIYSLIFGYCRWKYSHEFAWSLAKRYLKQSIAVKISVTELILSSEVGYGQAYSLEFNVFTRVIIFRL